MSKVLRLIGAMALATATVPFLGVSPAAAADTTIAPSTTGYFYAEGIRKPDESPQAPPNVTNTAVDRVAAGNLAVAAQAGQEDKVSFLLFDLLDVTPGSIVTKAQLTLPLVPNDADNASYGQAPEKVRACGAGDEGFNGDDGVAIQDAPARKCDVFSAPAKASADATSYVIDLTKLAQTWVDTANDGVALTAADGAATTPFQVVFAGGDKIKLALTYTAAPDSVLPPVAPPVTTPDAGGISGGFAPAPSVDSGLGSVSSPVLPVAPAPAPGVAPVAAPAPAAAAAPTGPIALSTSARPTNQFWLGALLLIALLVLLSLIMGDTRVAAASSKPSRLARALSERQRSTVARPAFGRPATI
ncbi:MAG: DNRLRE domain-containing protein [Frankiaceae bacterium]|nr:DNRLRE domain-containing protein [Frankiaceae bacterium]